MPVMEGKCVLFKEFGGVNAVPICLDTQDTEEIIKTVINIAPGFGGINLEDISAPRCFEIEERLKEVLDIPVFHDDQHGTAIVVLAGIINALFKLIILGGSMTRTQPTEAAMTNSFKSMAQLRLEDNCNGNNGIIKEFNQQPFDCYKFEPLRNNPGKA